MDVDQHKNQQFILGLMREKTQRQAFFVREVVKVINEAFLLSFSSSFSGEMIRSYRDYYEI